jgi:hypothetical protein
MHISALSRPFSPALVLFSFALVGVGCQTTTTTTNTNTTTTVVNTNSALSNLNANTSTSPSTTGSIDTREPESYNARLTVKIESQGSQPLTLPALTATVGKNGTDRRVVATLPGGTQAIFLDKADKRYVLLPAKKQYAELNPTSTGFDWQRLMTPGQLVAQLQRTKGVEKVGDDQFNGRAVTKYRIAGTAKTGTPAAGDVSADTFVYVDKETGLPLHSETYTQSTGEKTKNVPLKITTEMSDISTANVNPADFEIPQGYSKIPDEQVRQQVDKVESALIQLLPQIINMAQGGSSPAAAVSPSPTVTP